MAPPQTARVVGFWIQCTEAMGIYASFANYAKRRMDALTLLQIQYAIYFLPLSGRSVEAAVFVGCAFEVTTPPKYSSICSLYITVPKTQDRTFENYRKVTDRASLWT